MRVFVVEDSSLIRKRIIDNVKALGNFDVVGFAESEQEAIDAIVRTQPDVVVTDIRLKEGSGIEVVRKLRQQRATSSADRGTTRRRGRFRARPLTARRGPP